MVVTSAFRGRLCRYGPTEGSAGDSSYGNAACVTCYTIGGINAFPMSMRKVFTRFHKALIFGGFEGRGSGVGRKMYDL